MKSIFEFLVEQWAVIALIVSELLTFLPVKAQGIAKLVFRILTFIFGRKEDTEIKATNAKRIKS